MNDFLSGKRCMLLKLEELKKVDMEQRGEGAEAKKSKREKVEKRSEKKG